MAKRRQTWINIRNFFTVKFRKNLHRFKTVTSPQTCCCTTLQNVKWSTLQRHIHVSDNNIRYVRQCLFHEFLFVYLFFSSWYWHHYEIIAIVCLLHYSILSVMKINVWHSIKQCTTDASIDQWHSWQNKHMCWRRTF